MQTTRVTPPAAAGTPRLLQRQQQQQQQRAQRPHQQQRGAVLVPRAAKGGNKGFGKSKAGSGSGSEKKLRGQLAREVNDLKESGSSVIGSRVRVDEPLGEDWIRLCSLEELQASPKPTKPVILKTGTAVVLYRTEKGRVYCSDAYSTAYKYPLADAKVLERPSGPAVEVPLDGTVYDLATGKVLEWCPGNNPVRSVLGGLKSRVDPIPLEVYPAQVAEGSVYAKLVKPAAPAAA